MPSTTARISTQPSTAGVSCVCLLCSMCVVLCCVCVFCFAVCVCFSVRAHLFFCVAVCISLFLCFSVWLCFVFVCVRQFFYLSVSVSRVHRHCLNNSLPATMPRTTPTSDPVTFLFPTVAFQRTLPIRTPHSHGTSTFCPDCQNQCSSTPPVFLVSVRRCEDVSSVFACVFSASFSCSSLSLFNVG